MIWVAGAVVPDDALTIPVTDRAFEHGLGLFETLRTWQRQAPLLDRHLDRLKRSALDLGLVLPTQLPDAQAVNDLLEAEQDVGDRVLRITVSGGIGESLAATLWIKTAALPVTRQSPGARVGLGGWSVLRDDALARYKSLNYWSRRRAFERAAQLDFNETLSHSPDGVLWEGSRTNLFVVSGETLITPSTAGPIVPGVMRALVIALAKTRRMTVMETDALTLETLARADEVFLTNSVRGIIPVSHVEDLTWVAPGVWTRCLQTLVTEWIYQETS